LDETNILDETKMNSEELQSNFKTWLNNQIDDRKIFKHMDESKKNILKNVTVNVVSLNANITKSNIEDLEQELLVSTNISSNSDDLKNQTDSMNYTEKKFMNKIFGLDPNLFSNKLD